jgi:hypothetical protein
MNNVVIEIIKILVPYVVNFAGIVFLGVVTSAIKKYIRNDEIRKFVTDTVKFVEQTCKQTHGEEKLIEAEMQVSKILEAKGIYLDTDELRTLIESAVYELNNTLENKDGGKNG